MKADKVWLITHSNTSDDKGRQFVTSIREKLKQEKNRMSADGSR